MDLPSARLKITRLRFGWLLTPLVLLALATVLTLTFGSEHNMTMLYSQCHARSRLPRLSRVRVVGAPFCFLVSLFQTSLVSRRGLGVMMTILAFLAALLTVSNVEAARLCNRSRRLLAGPTAPWLLFNLLGSSALVWQLLLVPAFLHRAREFVIARTQAGLSPLDGRWMRHLVLRAEGIAIPVALALGFVLPAVVMLLLQAPVAVAVWLLFPLSVGLLRLLVRRLVVAARVEQAESFHLEASWPSVVAMYALPVLCSAVAHAVLVWSLMQPDDSKEMTRAADRFLVINVGSVGLTVLYWILVEAGWAVASAFLAGSLVLGPGGGLCLAWVHREKIIVRDAAVAVVAVGSTADSSAEDTPLLR